ncbi:MAG: deacylase [Alphaproteobacteria bacterium]|nr:deacylase [Alphaproteobacteria bacterium]
MAKSKGQRSRISTDVDFNADGKQVGYLRLPHSVHRSAYGYLAIPIAVIKNGKGPTLLSMSGNHGDEYEGQIANSKLIRGLDPKDVRGRVIVLPMANFPAAHAGMRTSPIDQGNLNRTFPGDPNGTPTWMISHYIETELMPLADVVLDLHSGGSSLNYIPSALARITGEKKRDARTMELLDAFAAPISYLAAGMGENRTSTAAAERTGRMIIGTELGGCGTVSIEGARVAVNGVRGILEHMGIVKETDVLRKRAKTRVMEVKDASYYVYAPQPGLFEPFVKLGATVKKGQPAGAVHFMDDPGRQPVQATFNAAGVVICERIPGKVERGDCLFHLATDVK